MFKKNKQTPAQTFSDKVVYLVQTLLENIWDNVSTQLIKVYRGLYCFWTFECRNVTYYIFNRLSFSKANYRLKLWETVSEGRSSNGLSAVHLGIVGESLIKSMDVTWREGGECDVGSMAR